VLKTRDILPEIEWASHQGRRPQNGLVLPPTGLSEMSFLSVDTRTSFMVDYPGEDGGKIGPLHAPLDRHDRRIGSVVRNGECDDWDVEAVSFQPSATRSTIGRVQGMSFSREVG
jgi:hypothetical protein